MDLLDILLNSNSPDTNDYYQREDGKTAESIEVELVFQAEEKDTNLSEFAIDGIIHLKKIFNSTSPSSEFLYLGMKPSDDRLLTELGTLNASEQRDWIKDIDPSIEDVDLSNTAKRLDAYFKLQSSAPKVKAWITTPSEIKNSLPRFERYSAMAYRSPESLVAATLKQVYEQAIYEERKEGSDSGFRGKI